MTTTKANRPLLAKVSNLRADPTQRMIFTIGNVNGDPELLTKMIRQVEECQMFCSNDKVVFLGNFISAEGDTQEIIDILRDYQKERPEQAVILRGAREQKMLCSKKNFFQSELGKGVLKSYRIAPRSQYAAKEINYIDARQFTQDCMWLDTLPLYFQSDKYFFVHSGVNPERDLDKQNLGGFMFIQDLFMKSNKTFNHVIVHSHTGLKTDFKNSRISVGQGEPSELTCLVLDDRRPKSAPTVFGKNVAATLHVKKEAVAS